MLRSSYGDHHTSYKIGALTMTSLRDGYVDMPPTRLRQPENKALGDPVMAAKEIGWGARMLSGGPPFYFSAPARPLDRIAMVPAEA